MNYHDWIKELEAEDRAHKDYRERAQKVVDRYEDEEDSGDSRFNILWSNVEVLHSALFNKPPTPDIRRRYLDRDPVGKQVAELSERAASYSIDCMGFDQELDAAVDDYLLPGMGQVRLRYKPYISKTKQRIDLEAREMGFDEALNPMFSMYRDGEQVEEYEVDELGPYMEEETEELVYEEVTIENVNWKSFRWQPSKRWKDCDWCAIEHYMTEEELKDNYGDEVAKMIPLGYNDKGDKAQNDDEKSRGRIIEIFDKKNRKNIELCEGYPKILKEEDDPLGLEDYYPFPKPLMTTLKNGKMIPIPDYVFYQDQAAELDTITQRIDKLTDQLRYRGVYDGAFDALQNVANSDDGDFVPIDDFTAMFEGKADLNKVIAIMPIEEIQRVLAHLYQAREQVKQVIYEITGIADIMRGSTKSSETLGAQQLKTQFGSMRLEKRRRYVNQFVRDVIRIMVEMMVENFQNSTLQLMTGIEVTPEMEQVFRNDLKRSYRIDIETDSTINEDAQTEKEQRIELVTAVTNFMKEAGPMVQGGVFPPNLAKELLGFAVRGFKVGRTLEDTMDEMGGDQDPRIAQIEAQAKQKFQEFQQMTQQGVQRMRQEHSKQIEALQKQLFEKDKALAISNEKTSVKLTEAQYKAEIQNKAAKYKTDVEAQLEVFKAKLDMLKDMPQRDDGFQQTINQLMQGLEQINQNNMAAYESISQGIGATNESIVNMTDYLKKPAKVVRDSNNRVIGATRD